MPQMDDLLRRPLYVFDLPSDIVATLELKDSALEPSSVDPTIQVPSQADRSGQDDPTGERRLDPVTSCSLCTMKFGNVQEQRIHVKSDLHGFNLKQKMRGLKPVTEIAFEKLIGDLDESISGSESSDSNEDVDDQSKSNGKINYPLANLLKKHASLSEAAQASQETTAEKPKRGAGKPPLIWLYSPSLPAQIFLGVYRALFTDAELQRGDQHLVDAIRLKQLSPRPQPKTLVDAPDGVPHQVTSKSPHVFLCMVGGGHFAAMVVSLAPQTNKKASGGEERQASVIAHKTFHRYTTRRKQGGAQSANDAAKGAAHSAGSSLRRYNEVALTDEIRQLLSEWRSMIDEAQLLFVRATGNTNRRTLYGPYDGQALRPNDPRIRTLPFSTRRATQAELMRAFVELTRVKVRKLDEITPSAGGLDGSGSTTSSSKPVKMAKEPPKPTLTEAEETASLHTSQLQGLIRRSKAPATTSYIASNSLSPDFEFFPTNTQHHHHASTPLHLAASINSHAVVLALLTKSESNPTVLNGDGKPAFDLAGERATRDAFRVARHQLGENRWDWTAAHVPLALSKAEAEKRGERERQEADKEEAERRKAEMARLNDKEASQEPPSQQRRKGVENRLGGGDKTGAQKREEETRGMTPEMRMKLERERRARAAEERLRRMQGGPAR